MYPNYLQWQIQNLFAYQQVFFLNQNERNWIIY
jgi:hypothetical protein